MTQILICFLMSPSDDSMLPRLDKGACPPPATVRLERGLARWTCDKFASWQGQDHSNPRHGGSRWGLQCVCEQQHVLLAVWTRLLLRCRSRAVEDCVRTCWKLGMLAISGVGKSLLVCGPCFCFMDKRWQGRWFNPAPAVQSFGTGPIWHPWDLATMATLAFQFFQGKMCLCTLRAHKTFFPDFRSCVNGKVSPCQFVRCEKLQTMRRYRSGHEGWYWLWHVSTGDHSFALGCFLLWRLFRGVFAGSFSFGWLVSWETWSTGSSMAKPSAEFVPLRFG